MPFQAGRFYSIDGNTDVQVTDGGTNASDVSNARTNLGISIYDAATLEGPHDALDHTALTGIPTEWYKVATSSNTRADVQAFLNTAGIRTVFLDIGLHTWDTTTLNIPAGKSLIGLSGTGLDDNSPSTAQQTVVRVNGSTGSQTITFVGGGTRIENIYFDCSNHTQTSGNVPFIDQTSTTSGWAHIENVFVDVYADNLGATTNSPAFDISRANISNCATYNCHSGYRFNPTTSTNWPPMFVTNCYALNSGNTAAGQGDFHVESSGIIRFLNCYSKSPGHTGFWHSGAIDSAYIGCRAEDCGGDGFNVVVSSSNTNFSQMTGCSAFNCTGTGIIFNSGGANGSGATGNMYGSNGVNVNFNNVNQTGNLATV